VRIYPHGRELRIVVNDVLFWSQLFRDHRDSRLGMFLFGSELTYTDEDSTRHILHTRLYPSLVCA
jgi:hypothetical protein